VAWLEYMLLGAACLKAWQVCRRGMIEMEELDANEESWKSIVNLEIEEGR
jgi:hypothetical protein